MRCGVSLLVEIDCVYIGTYFFFFFCCKLRLLYTFICVRVWIIINARLALEGDTVWFWVRSDAAAQVHWQAANCSKVQVRSEQSVCHVDGPQWAINSHQNIHLFVNFRSAEISSSY